MIDASRPLTIPKAICADLEAALDRACASWCSPQRCAICRWRSMRRSLMAMWSMAADAALARFLQAA